MRRLNNVTTTLYDLLYYFGIELNVFDFGIESTEKCLKYIREIKVIRMFKVHTDVTYGKVHISLASDSWNVIQLNFLIPLNYSKFD